MSERLEEIKDKIKVESGFYRMYCPDRQELWFLIEQAEKAEQFEAENERLRAALEFYADRKHYRELEFYDHDEILDQGEVAREALKGGNES